MKYLNFKTLLIIFLCTAFLLNSCTDLEEENFDVLTEEQIDPNDPNTLELVIKGVYISLIRPYNWRDLNLLQESSTEISVTPGRDGLNWETNNEQDFKLHRWNSTNTFFQRLYEGFAITIGRANSLLRSIGDTPGLEATAGEAKFYRALAYFNLYDLFRYVPVVDENSDPLVPTGNKPIDEQSQKVFNFIEQDLLEAVAGLPSKREVSSDYYPRATKEAAQTLLGKLYLNSEVWTGVEKWQEADDVLSEVIGKYSLTPSISDSYVPENEGSPEIIFSVVKSRLAEGNFPDQGGNVVNLLGLNQEYVKEVLGFEELDGFGGPGVSSDHYDTYDPDDFRRTLILIGPQNDPEGNLVIDYIPIVDLFEAGSNRDAEKRFQGLKSLKYVFDEDIVQRAAENDLVILRYADVLLMKAETQIRLNGAGAGDDLINEVRARNFDPDKPVSGAGLDELLAERGWEFMYDNLRRQDLVRFGKFTTNTYKFKEAPSEEFRNIFPLPQDEVDRNINMVQNPDYN